MNVTFVNSDDNNNKDVIMKETDWVFHQWEDPSGEIDWNQIIQTNLTTSFVVSCNMEGTYYITAVNSEGYGIVREPINITKEMIDNANIQNNVKIINITLEVLPIIIPDTPVVFRDPENRIIDSENFFNNLDGFYIEVDNIEDNVPDAYFKEIQGGVSTFPNSIDKCLKLSFEEDRDTFQFGDRYLSLKDLTPGQYRMIMVNRFDESTILHFMIGFNDAYGKTIKELFGARGVIANWNRNSIEY